MNLLDVALTILILLLSVAITIVMSIFQKRIGVEKMKVITAGFNQVLTEVQVKNSLAYTAVKFAQQLLPADKADEKFSEAATYLSRQLATKNINVSDLEIKALVESAVKEAKKEFGEQWKKTIKE